MFAELEEQKDLSTNRLAELEKLNKDHQDAMKEVERLKMDVSLRINLLNALNDAVHYCR